MMNDNIITIFEKENSNWNPSLWTFKNALEVVETGLMLLPIKLYFSIRAWKQSIDFPNFFYKTSLEAKIIHIIKCLSTHYNFDSRVMISAVLKEIGRFNKK